MPPLPKATRLRSNDNLLIVIFQSDDGLRENLYITEKSLYK